MQDRNGEFFVKGDTVMSGSGRVGRVHHVLPPQDHAGYVVVEWPGDLTNEGVQKLNYVGAGIGLTVIRGEA